MLLSMTGFGEAHQQRAGLAIVVEVRTINSKYFKLSLKCDDSYNVLEPEIESAVRRQVRRGTVQVVLRIDRAHRADDFQLNPAVLLGYHRQLVVLAEQVADATTSKTGGGVPLAALLGLPGVVHETPADSALALEEWPEIRPALDAALAALGQMRSEEGRAMAADLAAHCATIARELGEIAKRAPLVGDGYRRRLEERLKKILAEYQVTLDPSDLLKEVSIFAERSDISEEVVRLESHLAQFATFLGETDSAGRKLEFLTQEMFRETNTIGSKANDVEIARRVIEIKAAIERMREMIQNVE